MLPITTVYILTYLSSSSPVGHYATTSVKEKTAVKSLSPMHTSSGGVDNMTVFLEMFL